MIIPERTVACFSAFYKFEILWFIILSISKYFFVFFSRGHSFTAQTRRRTQEKSASKNQFVGRGSEGGKLIPFLFPIPPLPSPPPFFAANRSWAIWCLSSLNNRKSEVPETLCFNTCNTVRDTGLIQNVCKVPNFVGLPRNRVYLPPEIVARKIGRGVS